MSRPSSELPPVMRLSRVVRAASPSKIRWGQTTHRPEAKTPTGSLAGWESVHACPFVYPGTCVEAVWWKRDVRLTK
jgi:hypothetical protein